MDISPTTGRPTAGLPLGPAQISFFAQDPDDVHVFNQAAAFVVRHPVPYEVLCVALAAVTDTHEAFGLRFRRDDAGRWSQWWAGRLDLEVEQVALSDTFNGEVSEVVRECAERMHCGLDIVNGPLARATVVDQGVRADPLVVVVAHHLIVDAVSWRIFADYLDRAIRDLLADRTPALPAAVGFTTWTAAQARAATGWHDEILYWREHGAASGDAVPPPGPVERSFAFTLGPDQTQALVGGGPAARYGPDHVVLVALARAFRRSGGGLLVDIETHGREETERGVDPSRTVGWLTATWPYLVSAEPGPVAISATAVAERLRAVPHGGQGFGVLRAADAPELRALPAARVLFTYLGRYAPAEGSGVELVPADLGRGRCLLRRPQHSLVVNAWIGDGRLSVQCSGRVGAELDAVLESFAGLLGQAAEELTNPAQPLATAPEMAATETEEAVQKAWAEVLPRRDVAFGVTDDFFEVGGDSIHMIQIASRLRRAFGIRVPLKIIFDHTTVRDLAGEIDQVRDGTSTF